MIIALASAVLLLAPIAAPAPSSIAPAEAEPAPKPEKPKKPKMVCRSEVAIGSIMQKRVCRTPEQVEAEKLQAKRDTDSLSDHLAACRGAGC
jgi:hypothetical protein